MEAEKTGWASASAKFVFLFILAVNITGCTLLKSSVAALKSTAHFVPMGADQRVFAEPGGEDVAAIAAAEMANAMWMTKGPTAPKAVVEFTGWGQVEEFGRLICRM